MSRNRGYLYRYTVLPADHGSELAALLSRRFSHSTTEQWRQRIDAGQLLVDGARAQPELRLRAGQQLAWRRPPWDEPPVPDGFKILREDSELLAVAKPAGLPTLPGAGFLESTLLHRVRQHAPEAAPLHRLGRFTSGCVLFAKSRAARAVLSRQWAAQTVYKRYRAWASGRPASTCFGVNVPIGPIPHRIMGTVHASSPDGKPSQSRVRVVRQTADTFLCDVEISTGRPHQVRIHLAAAGHPLVGDPLYSNGGIPRPGCRALPGDPGYRLHAAELGFDHPTSGVRVNVLSEPPPNLR